MYITPAANSCIISACCNS